jgi:hypothetical protein
MLGIKPTPRKEKHKDMKLITKHHLWFYQIHLPIVTFIGILFLLHPTPILNTISAPILWLGFALLTLIPHKNINTSHLPPWRAWCLTLMLQFALSGGIKAIHYFTDHSFAMPQSTPWIQGTFPWFFYAAIAVVILHQGQSRGNLQPYHCVNRWFDPHVGQLCINQFAKITTQLATFFVLLPLALMFTHIFFNELNNTMHFYPMLNTIILIVPLTMLQKRVKWTKHLRFYIAHGTPIWLISCLIIIPVTMLLVAAQSVMAHLFILDKLLPPALTAMITQHPWPSETTRLSQHGFSLLWWIVWTLPIGGILSQLYKNHQPWHLLVAMIVGQVLLSPLQQHTLTSTQACVLACLSTVILCFSFMHHKGYLSLVMAQLPTKSPLKYRSLANSLVNNTFSLIFFILILLSFGLDWITWGLLTACMPSFLMTQIALFNLMPIKSLTRRLPSTQPP